MQAETVIVRNSQLNLEPYWSATKSQRECQADSSPVHGPCWAVQTVHRQNKLQGEFAGSARAVGLGRRWKELDNQDGDELNANERDTPRFPRWVYKLGGEVKFENLPSSDGGMQEASGQWRQSSLRKTGPRRQRRGKRGWAWHEEHLGLFELKRVGAESEHWKHHVNFSSVYEWRLLV